MNFPNPPTDNLYKFIAITGIILIALSSLAPMYFLQKHQNWFDHRMVQLFSRSAINPEELEQLKLELQTQMEIGRGVQHSSEVLGKTGLCIAIAGFVGWMFRWQVVQDEILRLERDKLKRDLEAATSRGP